MENSEVRLEISKGCTGNIMNEIQEFLWTNDNINHNHEWCLWWFDDDISQG